VAVFINPISAFASARLAGSAKALTNAVTLIAVGFVLFAAIAYLYLVNFSISAVELPVPSPAHSSVCQKHPSPNPASVSLEKVIVQDQ
jgi:hypothetical protein